MRVYLAVPIGIVGLVAIVIAAAGLCVAVAGLARLRIMRKLGPLWFGIIYVNVSVFAYGVTAWDPAHPDQTTYWHSINWGAMIMTPLIAFPMTLVLFYIVGGLTVLVGDVYIDILVSRRREKLRTRVRRICTA